MVCDLQPIPNRVGRGRCSPSHQSSGEREALLSAVTLQEQLKFPPFFRIKMQFVAFSECQFNQEFNWITKYF